MKRYWNIIAAFFAAFLVGSSFLLMKRALLAFTNVEVGLMRFFIAYLAFIPIALFHIRKIERSDWKYLFWVGMFGNAVPFVLAATGQQYVDSSIAGIVASLLPLFTALTGALFFKQLIRKKQVFGVAIGLVGAVGLVGASSGNGGTTNPYYALFLIVAVILYSININVVKSKLGKYPGLVVASVAFFLIGPIVGFFVLSSEIPNKLMNVPEAKFAFRYVLVLALVSTFVLRMIFYGIIRESPPVLAASVAYLVPVFAVIIGLADGEKLTIYHGMFGVLVLIAVYLVSRK